MKKTVKNDEHLRTDPLDRFIKIKDKSQKDKKQ